jgi:hypothetical protein
MRVVILAIMLFATVSTQASASTANELLAQCEQLERAWVIRNNEMFIQPNVETGTSVDAGRCLGYVEAFLGLASLHIIEPNGPETRLIKTCPPKGVSLIQLVRMFLQYARSHPGQLHEQAFFMMNNLLVENFPCPK